MKTILYPLGAERITVADAFSLMQEHSDGTVDIYSDGDNIVRDIVGCWTGDSSELQKAFVEFCKRKQIVPVCPAAPWSNDYPAEGTQNDIYTISVDEFRTFALPYKIEIKSGDAAAKGEAAPAATPKAATNKKAWDDAKLRTLWDESIMPGVTHASLAEKHGVTRQRIGTLLKEAKNKFSKMKSSPQNTNAWGQLINK